MHRLGAAADDYWKEAFDLNEQLVRNKPATFFMRVSGDAMTGRASSMAMW